MDTCKKVIISGNYKDMEEKINFLTSDDGSWCIDYEDEDLMDMATLEFYILKEEIILSILKSLNILKIIQNNNKKFLDIWNFIKIM